MGMFDPFMGDAVGSENGGLYNGLFVSQNVPVPRPDPRGVSDAKQDQRSWSQRLPGDISSERSLPYIPPELLLDWKYPGSDFTRKSGDAMDYDPSLQNNLNRLRPLETLDPYHYHKYWRGREI